MKNKFVQNCRFVHHAKFHCIMTTLNRLFKIEFERGGGTGKEPKTQIWFKNFIASLKEPKRIAHYDFEILREAIICWRAIKGLSQTLVHSAYPWSFSDNGRDNFLLVLLAGAPETSLS